LIQQQFNAEELDGSIRSFIDQRLIESLIPGYQKVIQVNMNENRAELDNFYLPYIRPTEKTSYYQINDIVKYFN